MVDTTASGSYTGTGDRPATEQQGAASEACDVDELNHQLPEQQSFEYREDNTSVWESTIINHHPAAAEASTSEAPNPAATSAVAAADIGKY